MRYLCVLYLFLAGCSGVKGDPDCGFQRTPEGENIVLDRYPIHMLIDDSIPRQYVDIIIKAGEEWERETRRQLFTFGYISHKQVNMNDGLNVISMMSWTGDNQQGYARLYRMGDKIKEADITLNSSNIQDVDIRTLVLHEMGHVLGLGHSPGTIMDPVLPKNTSRVIDVSLDCAYKVGTW